MLPNKDFLDRQFNEMAPFISKGYLLLARIGRIDEVAASYGYDATEAVLKQAAARLAENVDERTILATVREGLFVLFAPESIVENASRFVAEHLALVLAEPYVVGDADIACQINVAASFFPKDGRTINALFHAAEQALNHAQKFDQTIHFYDKAIDEAVSEKLPLEAGLRKAIERSELVNYYQPKIDLQTGKIVAAEALMRWIHPVQGLVMPASFIPTLESSYLIIQAGEKSRASALNDWRALMAEGLGPVRIAVNVTPQELKNPDFVGRIERLIGTRGDEAEALSIELTESSLMTDTVHCKEILGRLRRLGLPISIDDFGTGYSSLAYLVTLPIDELKIDRAFVMNMEHDKAYMTIVKTIIAMAHNLQLKVVAEGVENKFQVCALRALRCEQAQGYYYSRPVPFEKFRKLLKSQ